MGYAPSDRHSHFLNFKKWRQDKVCVLCIHLCAYACQLYWNWLSIYLVFHREGNKGKHIQRTTNCYILNQYLAKKVANIILNEITNQEWEISQEMSINTHKHAKKPSLPYPNCVFSSATTWNLTCISDISFYFKILLMRQAMLKISY